MHYVGSLSTRVLAVDSKYSSCILWVVYQHEYQQYNVFSILSIPFRKPTFSIGSVHVCTIFFFFLHYGGGRGIEGAKCVPEGAKIQKFVKNGWFWPFFFWRGGGGVVYHVGAEPSTGWGNPGGVGTWFWPFFLLTGGVKWGKSLQRGRGEQMPPSSPSPLMPSLVKIYQFD